MQNFQTIKKIHRVAQSKILKEFFADRFTIVEVEAQDKSRYLVIEIGGYKYRAIVSDELKYAMLLTSMAFDSPINIDDLNNRPRLRQAFYRVLANRIGKRNV
jgi:hypothetical protein